MGQILQVIIAIPQIISLAKEIIALLKKEFGNDWRRKVPEAKKAFKDLKEAKTKDDKKKSAKNIQSIIANL